MRTSAQRGLRWQRAHAWCCWPCCCCRYSSCALQGIKARVALNVHKDDVCQAVRADASLEAVHAQVA